MTKAKAPKKTAEQRKAVLKNSNAPQPRTMREAQERSLKTRRRTAETLKETKRADDERKAAKGISQPVAANQPLAGDARLGTGAGNPAAPAGRRVRRNRRGF